MATKKKISKKSKKVAVRAKKKTHSKKKKVAKKIAKKVAKKVVTKKTTKKTSLQKSLSQVPKAKLLQMHDLMLKARVLEERLIQIYKMGEAFFWIGSPGEEAFGVPLGMLAKKGQGLNNDYFHLHYRCTPTMVTFGMPMEDAIRLIMNKSTDRCTGGRNFSGHYCYPEWNVVPVTSPIETQYSMALGTAWSQKRNKSKGITVVSGGDAGTAEGEFASCLIWASRPGNELPMLITVQNNRWGISTDYDSQHGEKYIADRGKAFGMRTAVYNCNDPIEAYLGLKTEYDYIRKTGKPVLVECQVSRLHGHSSASGANRAEEEVDCLQEFEQKLLRAGVLKEKDCKELRQSYYEEAKQVVEKVRQEPVPQGDTIWDHTYVENENADWRNF